MALTTAQIKVLESLKHYSVIAVHRVKGTVGYSVEQLNLVFDNGVTLELSDIGEQGWEIKL